MWRVGPGRPLAFYGERLASGHLALLAKTYNEPRTQCNPVSPVSPSLLSDINVHPHIFHEPLCASLMPKLEETDHHGHVHLVISAGHGGRDTEHRAEGTPDRRNSTGKGLVVGGSQSQREDRHLGFRGQHLGMEEQRLMKPTRCGLCWWFPPRVTSPETQQPQHEGFPGP